MTYRGEYFGAMPPLCWKGWKKPGMLAAWDVLFQQVWDKRILRETEGWEPLLLRVAGQPELCWRRSRSCGCLPRSGR